MIKNIYKHGGPGRRFYKSIRRSEEIVGNRTGIASFDQIRHCIFYNTGREHHCQTLLRFSER